MKKFLAILMSAMLLGTGCLAACDGDKKNDEDPSSTTPPNDTVSDEIVTDTASISYVFNDMYDKGELKDEANGFSAAGDITGARFCLNGKYKETYTEFSSRHDLKLELYNGTKTRIVNAPAGMAFTLSTASLSADYSIAKYRTKYTFGDSILTFSAESGNPYGQNSDPWHVYGNEWLYRHLINDNFMNNNGITRLKSLDFEVGSDGSHSYPTANRGNLTVKPGYDVYRFDLRIDTDEGDDEIERPYYNIAIVREANDPINFALFVMKSKSNKSEEMDAIVQSYSKIRAQGVTRNYFDAGSPTADPDWNTETKEYFDQLMAQDFGGWGVFSYSMPGGENELHAGQPNYDEYLRKSKEMQEYIENTIWGGKKYDIYPTYTHIQHAFPTDMAKELAGGNGKNDKPVLQFTYQYTTNNNLVDGEVTPAFDILRGKYDEKFRALAQGIKEYGKPVLFRLNNEMNTDWTSYSGIMSLLDPDIFVMTWQRLYDIFREEGVDNCIWIWNPIADSCPYSSWGEDLCYFPGKDYVQFLGGTSYEMNNYDTNTAALASMKTFQAHYSNLYNKNKAAFSRWGVILSEFACGSGGNASGALGRNAGAQAKWVTDMFNAINAASPEPYVKQIKGYVWFNCNDYSGTQITNRLRFADPEGQRGESYDDLSATHEAFRAGFAAQH